MDKKNTIIGALFLAVALTLFIWSAMHGPPSPPAPQLLKPGTGNTTTLGNQARGPAETSLPSSSPSNAAFSSLARDNEGEKIVTLSNEFIEVHFTDFGGAIKEVALRKYPDVKGHPEPFILNRQHADPILAFMHGTFPGLEKTAHYDIVSQTATEVVFHIVFENRIDVTRRYSLSPDTSPDHKSDPYQIRHETTFRNLTDQTAALPTAAFSLGTASLVESNGSGQYLNVGYNDNKDIHFFDRSKLEGGGFLGFGRTGPIPMIETVTPVAWAAASSQFFTSIVTPDIPGVGVSIHRLELPLSDLGPTIGVTGAISLQAKPLPPKGESTLGMKLYVGPKDYKRLSNTEAFKQDEDKVMNFGFFKFFSQILLTIMTWVHSWTGNWGVAIIITTLLIKLGSLPFTIKAAKTSKRMQKLQPEMKALNEKYKDNPQKRSQALMELYKEKGVNPVGGCFPMLIPLPFFFGFFRMLGTVSELRYANFLWVHDLMGPDTVARVGTFPINILPLILGVTMIVQMRLVPQPSLETEQSQMTAKMMKFMPLFYVVFAYNMACAISLYSTVNGLFTIGQQLMINRMKDVDPVPAATSGKGKVTKNVTPPKKKTN